MKNQWQFLGIMVCLAVCLAFTLACGGGGSSGGSSSTAAASTTVAAVISYPSVSAKPGLTGDGTVQKTVLTGAVVTLTLPDGTQYQMTHTENGKYEVSVSGFDGSNGFMIEAHEGNINLTKLIAAGAQMGDTSSFDAGDVDDSSTAFVEIVKQVASAIADSIGTAGIDLSVATNLMDSLDEIKAQVDLISLSDEVEAGTNATYQQVVTSITGALQAADPNATDTTSVIASLDFTAVSSAITAGSITYPAASTDADAVRIVGQNLINAYLTKNATALSAVLAETLLWDGATKTDLISNWTQDWTEDTALGITESFSGVLVAGKLTDTEYWCGLKGVMKQTDSSGVVVDWNYNDDSINVSDRLYVEKIGGVWLVTGSGERFIAEVYYDQYLFYPDGNNGGTASSTEGYVNADVEQQLNTDNAISSLTNPTVIGGIFASAVTLQTDNEEDGSYKDWYTVDTAATLPSTTDIYTFTVTYESATGLPVETATASIPSYTAISSTGLTLSSFSVDSTTLSAAWVRPALPTAISELGIEIWSQSTGEDIYETYKDATVTTSISVSTVGMTSGESYTLRIEYNDLYGNDYVINKYFVMP